MVEIDIVYLFIKFYGKQIQWYDKTKLPPCQHFLWMIAWQHIHHPQLSSFMHKLLKNLYETEMDQEQRFEILFDSQMCGLVDYANEQLVIFRISPRIFLHACLQHIDSPIFFEAVTENFQYRQIY